MLRALAADFAALPGVVVWTTRDRRCPPLELNGVRETVVDSPGADADAFDRLAAGADWSVVIAPETDGLLLARRRRLASVGGRWLGPSPEAVAIAGDKQQTAERLAAAGVRVPEGIPLAAGAKPPEGFPFPAVLKPRDGAGSQGVRLVRGAADVPFGTGPSRLERFQPGQPASVAVLCGPAGVLPLNPCRQNLSADGTFRYWGGSLPLADRLAERAGALAQRAVAALPDCLGYVGIDLVLGAAECGRDDSVIEINPRLTTSYVGLRAATRDNLAGAMLAVAGGELPRIAWDTAPLRFFPDGRVERQPDSTVNER